LDQLYGYIQDINTHGYHVREFSSTYLDISDKYILPPVRNLGSMLYAGSSEKLRLRAKISLETEIASKAMKQILKKNEEEFYDSMAARRSELEAMYKPILRE